MKILINNVINVLHVICVGDTLCTVVTEGHTENLGIHTEGVGGDFMVVVKVRETYDLQTVKNKMTMIAIHTPKPDIIKKNYPGLLVQCRAYRPLAADVRISCASLMPLDPLGVGLDSGDVAPEDVFNPILYKAMSNKGMSQLEARINALSMGTASGIDISGDTADVDVDSLTPGTVDDFSIYYALLANTHEWKHAAAQSGLEMRNLKPLVYEMVYNVGDMSDSVFAGSVPPSFSYPSNSTSDGLSLGSGIKAIIGKAKEFPFIPCTSYSIEQSKEGEKATTGYAAAGFPIDTTTGVPANCSIDVPYLPVVCGCIIVPPSRLHELFFRMVVEWRIEFSIIRPLPELTNWHDLALYGDSVHYQNYSYAKTKEAITGTDETILEQDSTMVSSNVDIKKVM